MQTNDPIRKLLDAGSPFDGVIAWAKENLHDIASVRTSTDRDDTGISYNVSVSLRSLAATSFECGEDERTLWSRTVNFGQTDATVAGGYTFVETARTQERLASEIARLVRGGK